MISLCQTLDLASNMAFLGLPKSNYDESWEGKEGFGKFLVGKDFEL